MSGCSSTKICFNSNCKDVLERSRKGWRRRTGEFADLCDRCASAYEEGKFCETFHLSASGWRCCESCGKQIHCGCIVSFHMFVLLDAGGIECISCARKSFILTPNPAWPPPSHFLPLQSERIKDLSIKNWSQIAGSGPVPWRQAPSLFNTSSVQTELLPRMPFDADISSGIDQLSTIERLTASSLEKKKAQDYSERLTNGSLKFGASELLENKNAGIKLEERPNPCGNVSHQPSFSKNDSSISHFGLAVTSASPNGANDQSKVSGEHAQRLTPPPSAGNQSCGQSGFDSSSETQTRNGRPKGDARGRNQLLPRYWPRITDQELQQISGDSKITPLFEKMLSASDAGRIGRLVLPKKCAEAYFPPISQPEGLPLKVQDLKGKEWTFQFRFWPNNNSRMYVLEGVTPCIQSMQLQAGDIVTFSRLEPGGKLVMGFRKASNTVITDQVNETVTNGSGVLKHGDVSAKKSKAEAGSTHHHSKDEVLGAKSSFRIKRKNSTMGLKSKRLRIENEDLIELKITWGQAQGLLRPHPNHAPSIVVIEGCEFEEFEDAPIIGRPTIFPTGHVGENIQWAQCEDCFKWRKIPADATLPSRWTCSKNLWDPERSLCSVAQEITAEQLEDLIPTNNQADGSKKMKGVAAALNQDDPESFDALEGGGLDALADLAIIQEEGGGGGESSSQAEATTTKHPRHRPGCTCIVCIQPPSGKGPKHKQTCTCNVCLTVKRRFQTLMLRREKKQSDKEAETAAIKKQQEQEVQPSPSDQFYEEDGNANNIVVVVEDNNNTEGDQRRSSSLSVSPFKGQFDLNIQPERDEELSPTPPPPPPGGADSSGMMKLLQDATERYLSSQQQRFSSPTPTTANRNSEEDDDDDKKHHDHDRDRDPEERDHPVPPPVTMLSMNKPESASVINE